MQAKAGLEVAKIGITPSLTAEFTANPDFGPNVLFDTCQIYRGTGALLFCFFKDESRGNYVL